MTPGGHKIEEQGWLSAHRWLIARRVVQVVLLGVFLSGPLAGFWITKGTLASSLTLGLLPLTDPLMLVQSLLARHPVGLTAVIGAAIILAFYLLVGGRVYCAWVCPINPVTDLAAWMRLKLGLKESFQIDKRLRLWVLGGALAASAMTGSLAWEMVNPVTILHRGLVYGGFFSAVTVTLAIFLFDLGLAARGWCGSICPVGAAYGLLSPKPLLRVSAEKRDACNNCMDCFTVCPERQIIAPALRGQEKGVGPIIWSTDCTNCGRCIDVCSKDVFQFRTRFGRASDQPTVRVP